MPGSVRSWEGKRHDYALSQPCVPPQSTLAAGTIAGQKTRWQAMVEGESEPVLELDVCWVAGAGLEPEWPIHHGYTMEVEGNPNVQTRVRFQPQKQESIDDFIDMANTVTAMPVVAAIPTVCEAAPGIRTYADLPLITGHYVPNI